MGRKKKSDKGKRVSWWVGIPGAIILSAIIMLAGRTGLLYELELKSFDARFIWRGPVDVSESPIVIVAIDDETFATVPSRYPFPRSWYARMIRNLFASGARMVIFDVQFTEPSTPEEDAALAEATAEYADRIIHAGKIAVTHDVRINKVLTQALRPIEVIEKTGSQLGIVNMGEDRDGFTRQYPLYVEHGGVNYLPLALKALQILKDIPDTGAFHRDDPKVIRFGDFRIPRMTESTMLINFAGPAGTFDTKSLASVLDDSEFELLHDDTDYMQWFLMPDEQFAMMELLLPEDAVVVFRELRAQNPFKDKVIFVGASAAELQDLKKTPFFTYKDPNTGGRNITTPGVEVHANALQTLLDGSYFLNVPPLYEYLIIFLLMLAVFVVSNTTQLWMGTSFTILLAIGFFVSTVYLFIVFRLWMAVIAPITGILLAYISTTVYQFLLEQKEKAMIRGMFSQYVPKKVVSELIENPDMLKLGGEKRRMTALFTDVAGFTSVSEKLTPAELVALLNEYLSEMSNIILDNEGIIDKYEGDLIMAEWGAPIFFDEHAAYACRAALQMQKRLAELRDVWKEKGTPILFSRVGVNTGDMIVGNMGCLEVFDYTVMGDAVNLASRLEGANKSYETTIMIGPETFGDVEGRFVTRMLDDIRVKGKDEPVRVYELVAEELSEVTESKLKAIEHFNRGIGLYRDLEFADAKQAFEAAIKTDDEDGPSKTYLERCVHFIANPPSEDWDRVFVLTEK